MYKERTKISRAWLKYYWPAIAAGTVCILIAAASVIYPIYQKQKEASESQGTISLISGCQPAFSGADGHGTAELNCSPYYNPETMKADRSDVSEFLKTVSFNLISGDNGSLSNGDEVVFQADYDKELAEQLHLTIDNKQAAYRVNGLPESYSKWSDFSDSARSQIDDLASRAITTYFTDLYKDKVVLDMGTLAGKYLIQQDKGGKVYSDLYYLVKVVYTREVRGFLFSTHEKTSSGYYCITIPDLHPQSTIDTTIEGSRTQVTPLPDTIKSDQEARNWFIEDYPNAVDIYS